LTPAFQFDRCIHHRVRHGLTCSSDVAVPPRRALSFTESNVHTDVNLFLFKLAVIVFSSSEELANTPSILRMIRSAH
jgi:hypothetical protein